MVITGRCTGDLLTLINLFMQRAKTDFTTTKAKQRVLFRLGFTVRGKSHIATHNTNTQAGWGVGLLIN